VEVGASASRSRSRSIRIINLKRRESVGHGEVKVGELNIVDVKYVGVKLVHVIRRIGIKVII
tara:strand:+ start:142 stop:327 length:186 start_codon:yes stop_codon:yes gene_type:complete